MVNNGLELMHKQSYVALRSARQPWLLPLETHQIPEE
jgi:hypothetical protein